jgi:hypothetical protein
VAGDSSILGFGWPFADHDQRRDELLAAPAGASPRDTQRPARAQTGDELPAQRPATLDVEGLVDRLVGDPHGLIIGEVDPESVRDLLRAPRHRPSPIGPAAVTAADEPHCGTRDELTVGPSDLACQAVLDVVPQPVVGGQLGDLRPTGASLGMPLRSRRPIRQLVAVRRRVAAKLPRDRRRRTTEPSSDLTHAEPLRMQDCDLLALGEGQVAARHRGQRERRHPARLPEPPGPDRG